MPAAINMPLQLRRCSCTAEVIGAVENVLTKPNTETDL